MVEELPAGRGPGGRDQGVGPRLVLGREWVGGGKWVGGRVFQSHQEHETLRAKGNHRRVLNKERM